MRNPDQVLTDGPMQQITKAGPPMACLLLGVAALTSCGKGGQSVIVARQLVPEDIAKRAMELYDANSDGKVDAQEMKKSPALESALPRLDADKDRAVASEEIAARFRVYQGQSDLLPLAIQVERSNRPVADAEVVFQPAPFMGDNLLTFRGKSDAEGNVILSPVDVGPLPGLPLGMYDVRITGPVTLQRGCEVAEDTPTGGRLKFSL